MANKKFLSFGLISFMSVLCLAGCNKGGNEPSESTSSTKPEEVVTNGATGAFNYLAKNYDERAKILGQLEKYAIRHHLTGIPLFDDGGEAIYSSRLVFPTENYVAGYGWGVLREGNISNNVITDQDDPTGKWSWYLHYMQDENPTTLNGDDSQDSVGSNYDSYAHAGLYGTRLKQNASGDYLEEYEWYPVLAKSMPEIDTSVEGNIIEGKNGDQNLASTYKIYVKTGTDNYSEDGRIESTGSSSADDGEDHVYYSTLSNVNKFKKFNGKGVAPYDYEFAMRMLLSGDINYYRASQYIDSTPIVGAANYFNVSQQYGWKSAQADEAWEGVGYHVKHDDGGWYIQVQYQIPTNEFYAMYQITSFTTPVPQEFFEEVVGYNDDDPSTANYKAYGNVSGTYTPVDTYLSIGPYTVETWNTGDGIFTFKQNENWYEVQDGYYKVKGIKYKTNTNIKQDPEAVINAFFNHQVDSAGVTSTSYDRCHSPDYERYVKVTPGSTTWKWNVNSCDQETWNELFGTRGTIAQTPENEYYDLKPAMSNDDFLNGLFVASDRQAIADKNHSNPAFEYFTDEYIIDPENGTVYNDTAPHQEAIADYYPETMGYNESAAQTLFNRAIQTLVSQGAYKNGDTITIEAIQMVESEIDSWGSLWESEVEDIFNNCSEAIANNIKLDIDQWAVTSQMDVYNVYMNTGKFDLCQGSISGSTLDPLSFMEVLKSDNSSGFTLNWGTDTSAPTNEIQYDGRSWSYDGLWAAANQGVMVSNGRITVPYAYIPGSGKRTTLDLAEEDEDGNTTVTSHPAIALTFSIDTALADEAGIEISSDADGNVSGISYVSVAASLWNPNSTVTDDTGAKVETFSFTSTADKIEFNSARNEITVYVALDLAFDFTSVSNEPDKQEAYAKAFIEYFQNATEENPISFRATFTQDMKINDVPSVGSSSVIFTSGIGA